MPEKEVRERAARDKAEGKAPSTQAGEFVKEEIDHVREGKHGARSAKQAIAIGLSKARRAGVALPPPAPGKTSEKTRRSAKRDSARGHTEGARRNPSRPSPRRSRAVLAALKREGQKAASPRALSRGAKAAAARSNPAERSAAATRAVRTKGSARRKAAAKKAARTRAAHRT
jgi:hypothetical protein